MPGVVEYDPILREWFEHRFGTKAVSGNWTNPYYLEWVHRWEQGPEQFFGNMDGITYQSFVDFIQAKRRD